MKAGAFVPSIAVLVGACATVPDVTYHYFPAQAEAAVTVTQAVDCTSDKQALVITNTPAVVVSYSADRSSGAATVRLDQRRSAFSDSEATFTFFPDGRLKTINAWSQGQGEEILKSVISLIGTVAPTGGGGQRAAAPIQECEVIARWGNGKPVSLTYATHLGQQELNQVGLRKPFGPTPDSQALFDLIKARLPTFIVKVESLSDSWAGATFDSPGGAGARYMYVPLRKVRAANLAVLADGQAIWSGAPIVPDPSPSGNYSLPIPTAALFGKQNFALTLDEAGAIDTVTYGKLTGAAGAANVAGAATKLVAPSASDRAAALQAQADLIVQQQRLTGCKAKPADCK